MLTPTNEGLVLGKFCISHKGHKYMVAESLMSCHHLTVLLCIDHEHDPVFPSPEQREQVLRTELADFGDAVTVETLDCTAFPYAKEDDKDVSAYWAQVLHDRFPKVTTLFGSEKYVEYMAEAWPECTGIRHQVIDIDRKAFPISATMIRENAYDHWDQMLESAKALYTKNVLVVGAESCGKSTLVKNLGSLLKAPIVPEMYRSMFPEKGMDFTSSDLIRVAKAQVQAGKIQAASPMNKGLIIHDTCVDTTAIYHKEYYTDDEAVHASILEQRVHEKFDLIIFCDNDVAWIDDGTRTLGNVNDRKRMRDTFYSMAREKGRRHGCDVVVVAPDYKRLPEAMEHIKEKLCVQ